MIVIDGTTYNIPVVSLNRVAEFLDKYAERSEDGDLKRELIGVFFNYSLKFGKTNETAEYAALWQKLTEPVEFHEITVPDGDNAPHTFIAYFSGIADELKKSEAEQVFWKNLTVNFIAKQPARIPS